MATHEHAYQRPEYLVESDWLQKHLDDDALRVFDCSVNVLPNPDREQAQQFPFVYQAGRADFDQAHIPGAGFIDIPGELSDPSSRLPLMRPSEEQFIEVMRRHGINNDSRVVLYSTTEMNWATRVWWMLHAFGFDNAAVLNGGWARWKAEGRPASDQACIYAPGGFSGRVRSGAFVDKDEVLTSISDNGVRIISALPSPVHTGSSDVVFGRKGRIAGSVNVPFASLHDDDTGGYLSAARLREKFAMVDVAEAERIITYCGGGIAASNAAFTLSLLGYDNVSVYDGSMLEWGNDASLPMDMD
ncbi:sulfurtransferase [Sulfuriflexus mobilis]|uniref:sulfurtransferase n=1 Tax=Sulfuriflexus mobilis TaxID=1811807 RepID=UPI000F84439E|nr:sulfurtransferase [Sulfuriflexus mobilis]